MEIYSPEEALLEALRMENEREVVRGYSPAQYALGRAPDENGRFGDPLLGNYLEVLCENPQGEFQRNMERMRATEQAHTAFVYDDRIKRAQNSRSYRVQTFMPGDLVFVWRIQTRGPAASARTGVSQDHVGYLPRKHVLLKVVTIDRDLLCG